LEGIINLLPVLDAVKTPVLLYTHGRPSYINEAARLALDSSDLRGPLADFAKDDVLPRVITGGYRRGDDLYDVTVVPIPDYGCALTLSEQNPAKDQEHFNAAMESIVRAFKLPLTLMFSAENILGSYMGGRDEKNNYCLSVIMQNSYRLLRCVHNLSLLVDARNGLLTPQRTQVNPFELIGRIAQSALPAADGLGIRLELPETERKTFIYADARLIERALLNLLANAFKHTPSGGCVRMDVTPLDQRVILSVSDNGDGVPEKILPYVFQRYTLPTDAFSEERTPGLGLAVVKAIAAAHGGSVMLESPPKKGTTVRMTLPVGSADDHVLREDALNVDYAGGLSHLLLEFSDVLPTGEYKKEIG